MKSIVYIGADVHKDTYSLCAVEGATGAIILENKVNASAKKIEGFIGKIKGMRVDLNDADFITLTLQVYHRTKQIYQAMYQGNHVLRALEETYHLGLDYEYYLESDLMEKMKRPE